MTLVSKSGIATVAVATGLVLTAGTSGAVAGAMITGKQIKNNTVTTKDIKNNDLTGADVADGSLAGADVADGSLGSADLSQAGRYDVAGARASGLVTRTGALARFRGAAGVTATVTKIGTGLFCIRLSGTPTPVDATTAVLVATPNYQDDTTSAGSENEAVVEVWAANETDCAGGFAVFTYERSAGNDIAIKDQSFTFLIG